MRHDLCFLLLSVVCLVTGVSIGIYMGIAHDFNLAPVHAHLNLLGWASLALFGLIYRSYPQLGTTWTATLHVALCAPSAVLMPAGIALAILHEAPILAICAAFVWLAGCLVMLAKVAAMVMRSAAGEAVLSPAE